MASTPAVHNTPTAVADTFLAYASARIPHLLAQIDTCLARLTEAQIQHRGAAHENSIGALLLHLEGNVRQWILHGIADQPDVRRRDDEFDLATAVPSSQARAQLAATLAEAAAVIAAFPPARLLVVIDPQPTGTWRHTTILEAIFKIVSHLDHHTGQIILLTKQLAATDLDLSMPRKR